MYIEEIRRAVLATPRERLAEIQVALWKSHAAGAIGDDDAQALAEAIQARKTAPPTARRSVGSRPRSPQSIERRRRWTSQGWLPPQIAARFTLGEQATLAVVAEQIRRHGRCSLAIAHLGALAGVSRSTVKNALRQAEALGLLAIQRRPIRPFRHDTNVVTLTSKEWSTWLAMRSKASRSNYQPPRDNHIHTSSDSPRHAGSTRREIEGGNRKDRANRGRLS